MRFSSVLESSLPPALAAQAWDDGTKQFPGLVQRAKRSSPAAYSSFFGMHRSVLLLWPRQFFCEN